MMLLAAFLLPLLAPATAGGVNKLRDLQLQVAADDFVPVNDACAAGIPLSPGDFVEGNNMNATAETLTCSTSRGATLWYSVVGTGGRFLATTCTPQTNYSTTLVVTGSACGANVGTTCEYDWGGDDCENGSRGATVEWFSIKDKVYNIAVSGYNTGNAAYGTFGLEIMADELPDNDVCEAAEAVEPSVELTSTVVGSNENATNQDLDCATSSGATVWYTVMGTGARFLASTCNPETTFKTTLTLSDKPCDAAGDVCDYDWGGDCDDGNIGAEIEWFTKKGTQYTLAVAGYTARDQNLGTFGLTMLEYLLPENDVCDTAELVEPGYTLDTTVVGNTENATLEALDCLGSSETPTVWYTMVGTGARFRVSTCTDETVISTNLVVSERDCDSVDAVCLATGYSSGGGCGDGIGSTTEFFTTNGTEYKIAIKGTSSKKGGEFGLSVMEYILPENDSCDTATPLEIGPTPIVGSTANATSETLDCTFFGEQATVWYEVVGTGEKLTLSTCNEDALVSTQIAVSKRDCDSVGKVCIPTFSVPCTGSNLGSTVEFESEEGQLYKIAVFGSFDSGDFGSFSVTGEGEGAASESESSDEVEEDTSAASTPLQIGFIAISLFATILLGFN